MSTLFYYFYLTHSLIEEYAYLLFLLQRITSQIYEQNQPQFENINVYSNTSFQNWSTDNQATIHD